MRRLPAVLVLVMTAVLLAAPSSAVTVAELQLVKVGDLVTLPELNRVVVMEGDHGQRVQVLDLDGNDVGMVSRLTGLRDMTRSTSGDRAVVARADQETGEGEIDLIDPMTLQVTAFPLGQACPSDVEEASGRYWYIDECRQEVRVFDPVAGEHVQQLAQAEALAVSPIDGGVIFALGGLTTETLTRYDAETGEAVQSVDLPEEVDQLGDLTVSPDGTEVVASVDAGILALDAVTLEPVRRYPSAVYGNLAFRDDGVLAVLESGQIRFYLPGSGRLLNTYPTELATAGAFAGDTLYFGHGHDRRTELRTLIPRSGSQLKIDLLDRAVDYQQGRFQLSLTTPSAERTVKLYLDPRGPRPEEYLRSVEVPEGEKVQVRAPVRWNGVVIARYSGDAFTEPDTHRTDTVFVHGDCTNRAVDYVRKVGRVHLVRPSSGASIVGRIRPIQPGRRAEVSYQWRIHGTWQVAQYVPGIRMDDRGRVAVRLLGRREFVGLTMRMSVGSPIRKDTSGCSGELIYYRWIS